MMRIHHVGYLVKNLEKAQRAFSNLGFTPISEIVYDTYRNIDILFVEKDGYVIELVTPKSKQSVVAQLIKTYKNSPYHLCYEAKPFEEELDRLEHSGYIRIDNPTPAPAIGGKVCFLLSPSIGLIELLDPTPVGYGGI